MSWTDSATVKKHIMQSDIADAEIENEEHTLRGTDPEQLKATLILDDSEEVKTIDLAEPYGDGAVTLTNYNLAALDYTDLVPGSVVVADNAHRSTVYVEGVDYVVDYEDGKIRRAVGSAISSGSSVYIWYLFFTVHIKDTDYTIDYEAGTITRVGGGGIADGGIVYVDYESSASTVTDSLISEAITEAEDKILRRLSDDYDESSTDQGLKTGATELAVSIICNSKAMDIMNRSRDSSADDMSKQWREQSNRYEKQAWETLSYFLKKPAVRSAAKQQNRSFDNWGA